MPQFVWTTCLLYRRDKDTLYDSNTRDYKSIQGGNISGAPCYLKGKERGAYFEIKCIKDIIISKESKGEDATFERKLLKSWSKYKGYEKAKDALAECGKPPHSLLANQR